MEEQTLEDLLKKSPMTHFSSGSKELFHSNFLYWISVTYPEVFKSIMTKLCCIKEQWPDEWWVKREYKNLDLCIIYKKDNKEYLFIVLENKVKSLPYKAQLEKYEKKIAVEDKKTCKYILLSLPKNSIREINNWEIHHYDELAKIMGETIKENKIEELHLKYIEDYCIYIENLSQLVESWKIDETSEYLAKPKLLPELRINDLYEKLYYSQMANMLKKRLEEENLGNKIVFGNSKISDVLSSDKIFIATTFTHAQGLIEAKIKMSEESCYVIQLQGNRYCHAIETKNITVKKFINNPFVEFENPYIGINVLPHDKLCKYGDSFKYKYQKVEQKTIKDLLDAFVNDIKAILK